MTEIEKKNDTQAEEKLLFGISTPKVPILCAEQKFNTRLTTFLELAALGRFNLWLLPDYDPDMDDLSRGEWLKAEPIDIYEALTENLGYLTIHGSYYSGEGREAKVKSTGTVNFESLYIEFNEFEELKKQYKEMKAGDEANKIESKKKENKQGLHHSEKREKILGAGIKALITMFEEYIKEPNDLFLQNRKGKKCVNISAVARFIDDHRYRFELGETDENGTASRGMSEKHINKVLCAANNDKTLRSTG